LFIFFREECTLIGPSDHDKPEGIVGLLHGVDGLSDISTRVWVPILLGDGIYRSYYRLIEISSDGKLDSSLFPVVEDLGLMGDAVGSERGDLLPLGQMPDTVLDKGSVSSGRGNIALSELISGYQTVLCGVTYHGHIAQKTFIDNLGCLFLSFNAGGIDIEGVAGDSIVFHGPFQEPSVYLSKAMEATVYSPVPQPVAEGI
jgi:hypothetical protein